MSLKAGRVGVNPADVDPVSGRINSSSTEGYTKAEADDKFLSKSDANTALAAKQPINLQVPISMLEGTQLVPKTTVESIFATMDEAMTNRELTEMMTVQESACTDVISTVIHNKLYKYGRIVMIVLEINDVTAAVDDVIAKLPSGYMPIKDHSIYEGTGMPVRFKANGDIILSRALNNGRLRIGTTWITS